MDEPAENAAIFRYSIDIPVDLLVDYSTVESNGRVQQIDLGCCPSQLFTVQQIEPPGVEVTDLRLLMFRGRNSASSGCGNGRFQHEGIVYDGFLQESDDFGRFGTLMITFPPVPFLDPQSSGSVISAGTPFSVDIGFHALHHFWGGFDLDVTLSTRRSGETSSVVHLDEFRPGSGFFGEVPPGHYDYDPVTITGLDPGTYEIVLSGTTADTFTRSLPMPRYPFEVIRTLTVEDSSCAVSVDDVSPDGGLTSLPSTTPTSETLLTFQASVTDPPAGLEDPTPQWSLEVPDLGIVDDLLTGAEPGVTISPDGAELTIDFKVFRIASGTDPPVSLANRTVFVEAFLDVTQDPEGKCTADRREVFVEIPCEVSLLSVVGEDGASIPLAPPTHQTVLTFTADRVGSPPEVADPPISWQIDAPGLGLSDHPITPATPGVTLSPFGETLTVDFRELRVPGPDGAPVSLLNQDVLFEATVSDQDDPTGFCSSGTRLVRVELPCEVTIVSPAEGASTVPTTTIDVVAELTSPPTDDAVLRWRIDSVQPPAQDVEILADQEGVTLSPDGTSLSIDFRNYRIPGFEHLPLLNRLVEIEAFVSEEDDPEAVCNTATRAFFPYDKSPGQNGISSPGQDVCNTSHGVTNTANAPQFPIPTVLRTKLDASGQEGQEPSECSCPGAICTFVFNSMGDPVGIATGQLAMREFDASYCVVGEDFRALRSYEDRKMDRVGLFGRGWTFAYERSVEVVPEIGGALVERDGMGTTQLYEADGQGGFEASPLSGARITVEAGEVTVRQAGGVVYRYDLASGHLLEVTDRNANAFSFSYAGPDGALSEIVDAVDRRVRFGHTPEGRISWMELPDGSRWVYTYAGSDADLLASVTDPRGNTTRYEYGPAGMTLRRNAAGEERRWERDPDTRRVVRAYSETDALSTFSYDLDARRTTWTDTLGATTTYEWNEAGLVTRAVALRAGWHGSRGPVAV